MTDKKRVKTKQRRATIHVDELVQAAGEGKRNPMAYACLNGKLHPITGHWWRTADRKGNEAFVMVIGPADESATEQMATYDKTENLTLKVG